MKKQCFGISLLIVLFLVTAVTAQQAGNPELQEKLAAIKQHAAQNQAALHKYQWVEVTQVAVKGEVKSTKQNRCRYSNDGTVIKTPMDTGAPQQQQSSGGGRHPRLKEKIIENKKEEMTDYMQQVKALIDRYVPPSPESMQAVARAGNIALTPSTTPGVVNLVFKNYALNGDSMTLSFLAEKKEMTALNVNSYLDDPKDTVTLMVAFGSLTDGTDYPEQVVLNATGKNIQVTINNINYQQVAP